MKIIEINATYGFASTGSIVMDIEKTARENGHSVGVAYQKAEVKPENGIRVGGVLSYKLHAVLSRVAGRQGYASYFATKRLISWLERQKPDIVHLHNLHSNYINIPLLLAFLAKKDIATVLTLHDCWFFTGKCFHFVESHCDKWKKGCGDCPRNKLDIKSLFFDRTARVFKDKKRLFESIPRLSVVGCSDWISDMARQSLLSSKEITRIYNGIDTDLFAPKSTTFRKENNIGEGYVVLGAANKWLLPENLELFDKFLKTRDSDDLLVLFGADEDYRQLCKNKEGVILLGYINSKEEMANLFASADVFVNPTHADTLPTVNMEAASSGIPVVTYNVCGSPELVKNGVSGYVVEEGDIDGMLTAIRWCKAGKIKSADCRDFALANFDKNDNYKRYIELFERIYNGEELL